VGGDIDLEKFHHVTTDDYAGGFMAGEYLAKRGHKKILFVSEIKSRPFVMDRLSGFRDALSKYGVKISNDLILSVLDMPTVYETVKTMVKENDGFTAIFCADGIFLRAVFNAVRDVGKSIPDDYSLISYDKSEQSECSGLKIVEVIQPLEKLGSTAVKELVNILSGRRSAILRGFFKPSISEGDSCRSIDWKVE
jgi:LacI family transcriptional regulator